MDILRYIGYGVFAKYTKEVFNMKKRNVLKCVIAMGLAVVMIFGSANVKALAAPSSTITTTKTKTVTGAINGAMVQGYLGTNSLKSHATTTFAPTGGKLYVTAYIYYWYGEKYYATTSGTVTASSGGASATATKQLGGADVVAGKSTHKVVWEAYTWSPSASVVGTIPSSYTWK